VTRQAVWIAIALAAAGVLSAVWFLNNFEQVPVTRHEASKPEARRNPYLALERFLARMGREPARADNFGVLDAMGGADVLILDRNRRRSLDGPRGERLLAWVESGGYLLVAAEQSGVDDPLLQALGVEWAPAAVGECRSDDAPATPESGAEDMPGEPPATTVQVPGSTKELTLETGFLGLKPTGPEPTWRVEGAGRGAALLHFERGRGHVTVVADLARLADNRQIGRRDHAELVWTLLQHHRPEGRVWLASRLEVPTLGQWLAESAWMVLASAALLLAAWLGRIVPRFGGLAPEPVTQRRSLSEHLTAMGRFVAASGGLTFLLEAVRAAFQARLALRHPALASLPVADQRKALARIAGLPPEDLRHALETAPRGRAGFTDAVATLQKLELRL
jgi:hypothetical protein